MVPRDCVSAPRSLFVPNFISDWIGESPIFSAVVTELVGEGG